MRFIHFITAAALCLPFAASAPFGDAELSMFGAKPAVSVEAAPVLPQQQTKPPFTIADSSKIVTTSTGLKYYVVSPGVGNRPKKGANIIAHYHGMLADGSVFDSSFEKNKPFNFKLGQGQVIKGWDEGFQYLRPGAKAVLIIPPELGYGAAGSGENIPPNSTLYFHVELLGFTG